MSEGVIVGTQSKKDLFDCPGCGRRAEVTRYYRWKVCWDCGVIKT